MGNVGRPPVRKRDVKNKERHYEKMELGTPTLDGLGSIGRRGGTPIDYGKGRTTRMAAG